MKFTFGIAALILGYALTYSGVSMFKADKNNPGVGLFQALGVSSGVGFDVTGAALDNSATVTPDNPAPTTTGQPPQTTSPTSPTFVQV